MLSLFQMQVSVPNQHPPPTVPWVTLLLAWQAAANASPQAEPSDGTLVSPYRFFETFLVGHCYLKIFMHIKSVFAEASVLLQSCTDVDLYFVRLLCNVISGAILKFTMSAASQFYTVRATGFAYTLLLSLQTVCYCQLLQVHHSIFLIAIQKKKKKKFITRVVKHWNRLPKDLNRSRAQSISNSVLTLL